MRSHPWDCSHNLLRLAANRAARQRSQEHGRRLAGKKQCRCSGKPVAQYAYTLPPIPVAPVEGGFADNGLSGMVNINDREFITIERAYAGGKGNTVRLMRAKIDHEVTDVSRMDSLAGKSYTPLKKTLLLEMPLTYQNVKIDNIEAITWGKKLRNGNRSLVLAVDNNFNPVQVTQFMAFEVIDR